MADITVDEVEAEVRKRLPVGEFTEYNIYNFQRSHSTDGKAGNELNAVTVEFQAEEKQEADYDDPNDLDEEQINSAITNQYQPEFKEDIRKLGEAMEDVGEKLGYRVINRDMVSNQWGRLMYEFRAPTTGTAEWLKDE